MMYGEDVLGWYLITLRYYRRYYKPVMHTETSTPFPELNPRWLWKQWTNVLRMRRDGIPVLGFTWYSLIDQVDWDTQLAEKHGRVNACGLYDLDRQPAPGGGGVPEADPRVRPDHRPCARRDVRVHRQRCDAPDGVTSRR